MQNASLVRGDLAVRGLGQCPRKVQIERVARIDDKVEYDDVIYFDGVGGRGVCPHDAVLLVRYRSVLSAAIALCDRCDLN